MTLAEKITQAGLFTAYRVRAYEYDGGARVAVTSKAYELFFTLDGLRKLVELAGVSNVLFSILNQEPAPILEMVGTRPEPTDVQEALPPPNAREIELAHQVDAEYVRLSESAETLEEEGDRCRAFFAQKLAEYRAELTGADATDEPALARMDGRIVRLVDVGDGVVPPLAEEDRHG